MKNNGLYCVILYGIVIRNTHFLLWICVLVKCKFFFTIKHSAISFYSYEKETNLYYSWFQFSFSIFVIFRQNNGPFFSLKFIFLLSILSQVKWLFHKFVSICDSHFQFIFLMQRIRKKILLVHNLKSCVKSVSHLGEWILILTSYQ